jgi:hypothetical protein
VLFCVCAVVVCCGRVVCVAVVCTIHGCVAMWCGVVWQNPVEYAQFLADVLECLTTKRGKKREWKKDENIISLETLRKRCAVPNI